MFLVDGVDLKLRGLGAISPFFPGILLSRKPTEPQGKQRSFFKKIEGWWKIMGNQPPEEGLEHELELD